ncbi:MAG: CoA transferase subunit A [Acidobacteriota bacterium]
MDKIFPDAASALGDVPDSITVMIGGVAGQGVPEHSVVALRDRSLKDLTVISSQASTAEGGVGLLLQHGQVKTLIASFIGESRLLDELVVRGGVKIILVPEGTLAERIRAGGAGLGGVLTPTGVGTIVAEGKETRTWNGKDYVLELPLRADLALVKAWRGDAHGNLVYQGAARNFNPIMAMAAAMTVAEVDEIVPAGSLDPDHVHTPGVYVKRLYCGSAP